MTFQSPFHRGNGCYEPSNEFITILVFSFSPLFIGAMVATDDEGDAFILLDSAFSPLFIGAMVATQGRAL